MSDLNDPEASNSQEPFDGFQEVFLTQCAFNDVGIGSGLHPFSAFLRAVQRGYKDHWQVLCSAIVADGSGQLEAVHSGHVYVGHDKPNRLGLELCPGVQAVDSLFCSISSRFDDGFDQGSGRERIVDAEDQRRRTSQAETLARDD